MKYSLADLTWASPSGYWYVATPYSRFPGGIEDAYQAACIIMGALYRRKIAAFSPIAHTHGIAIHANIDPLDHDIWLQADKPMMDAAMGLLVVELPTWETSFGIGEEIKAFRAAGKPMIAINPETLECRPLPRE